MNFNDNTVMDRKSLKSMVKLISNNMIKTRPEKKVEYRPYIKPDFVKRSIRSGVVVELGEFFKGYACGDYAYVSTDVLSQDNSLVTMSVKNVSKMWVNGEAWKISEDEMAYKKLTVELEKGYNHVIFQCVAQKNSFNMEYTIGHVCYPWLWICDYLLWVKDTVPMKLYKGEQGLAVSELVKKDESKSFDECKTEYPKKPLDDNIIDLNLLYGDEKGEYAVSYTNVKKDGILNIKGENIRIFKNNVEVGCKSEVKKGDIIFVVSKRSDGKWGFECESNDILHLTFLTSERNCGDKWIHIGAFDNSDIPVFGLDSLYKTAEGKLTYWRFTEKDVYLRPYLDTSFFGQWFYGLMVGEYGLMRAGELFGKYYQYFRKSMGIMIDYYEYMQYDAMMFGSPTFLKRSISKDDLDSIGTIGMNICEIYNTETDEVVKEKIMVILQELIGSIYRNIPRMEDGSFCRNGVVWADDTYMSCPFIVRMGNITGDTRFYDEAIKQLLNYTKMLYMNDEGVFAHIYYIDEEENSGVPWGRGNGWVYLSFAEVIEHLPDGYNGKSELEEIFRNAIAKLVKLQGENGMWHQVLNVPSSYNETSCTAIFLLAIAKGIRMGLLDYDIYFEVIKKAVTGLLSESVDERGNIFGVCRGSGSSKDANYYASLGTVLNDDHGTGMVIAALCEMIELINK